LLFLAFFKNFLSEKVKKIIKGCQLEVVADSMPAKLVLLPSPCQKHAPMHFLNSLSVVCLFHLHPPITRKRWWRYILDKCTPA